MKRGNSVRLTRAVVDKAKARPSSYFVWDLDQPGFGLRVQPSGVKAFYVQYRVGRGRTAKLDKLKLGDAGTMRVEDARNEARIKRGLAADGKDPAKERRELRNSSLVSELIDLYENEGLYCRTGKRQGQPFGEKTKRYTMGRLRNHVVPILGKLNLCNLTEKDVETLFKKVSEGATATGVGKDRKRDKKGKAGKRSTGPEGGERKAGGGDSAGRRSEVCGGVGAARKVIRDFSSVCSFAVERGLMASNPVRTAKVSKVDGERKSYLTLAMIERLGKALDDAEQLHGVNPKGPDQIRLWLLTGLRREEGAGLLWDEVDFERNQIVLKRSKSIPERPLTPEAHKLLMEIWKKTPKVRGRPASRYVFPAEHGIGHYTGTKRILPRLKRLAGLDELFPHLLRHTLGSSAVSAGLSLQLIGAILGHKNPRSTLVYAHVQDKAALDAAAPVASSIACALVSFKSDAMPCRATAAGPPPPLVRPRQFVHPAASPPEQTAPSSRKESNL